MIFDKQFQSLSGESFYRSAMTSYSTSESGTQSLMRVSQTPINLGRNPVFFFLQLLTLVGN